MTSSLKSHSFLLAGLGLSVIIHAAFIGLLVSSDKLKTTDTIVIQVQRNQDPLADKASRESTSTAIENAEAPAAALTEKSGGAAVAVSGESLGLRAHYPRISRAQGEFGEVKIEIQRDENGERPLITLLSSSGFARLDHSALATVQAGLDQLAAQIERQKRMQLTFVFKLSAEP